MVFNFKRRSRANSYVDHDAPPRSQSFDEYSTEKRPDSSRRDTAPHRESLDDENMYPRPQQPQETLPTRGLTNGSLNALPPSSNQQLQSMSSSRPEPMPDLLAQAFNQAIRPYTEKIEQLESQLADMQAWVDQLEQQRAEVHSWIDKRGLRPDVPPSIAKIMDTTTPDAALALNAQLDRKITIVNFDLHRLQDDLNDSISSSHFASAMLKFLPDIHRLALLPQGPRHAFDLVLKLGGNLNSHGGIDSADSVDISARRDFYEKLDTAMLEVVSRRFGESEDWNVQREVKRIEKTAAYLKTYGVEPYFPQTLDLMKRELEYQPHSNGVTNGQVTPPRSSEVLNVQRTYYSTPPPPGFRAADAGRYPVSYNSSLLLVGLVKSDGADTEGDRVESGDAVSTTGNTLASYPTYNSSEDKLRGKASLHEMVRTFSEDPDTPDEEDEDGYQSP